MPPRAKKTCLKGSSIAKTNEQDALPKECTDIKEGIAETLELIMCSSGSHEKRLKVLLDLHSQKSPVLFINLLSSFILYQLYEATGLPNDSYKRLMNFLKDFLLELHRSTDSDQAGIAMIRYFLPFENDKDKVVRQRVVHVLHQVLQTLDSKQESSDRNTLYDTIVEVFKRRLHDKSAAVADQAARACACFISQEDVLQQLLCVMRLSDAHAARTAVVNALTRTPPTDANIVHHVLRGVHDIHPSVRREAWEGLSKMRWGRFVVYAGENIIPHLHFGITDANASVQSAVAKTLLSAWATRDNANDISAMLKKIQASIVNDYSRLSNEIDDIVLYLLRHVRRLNTADAAVQLDLSHMSTHNTLLWRLSAKLEHESETAEAAAQSTDGFETGASTVADALSLTDFCKIVQTIAIRIHEPNKAAPKGAPSIHVIDFENESLLIARQLLLMIPVYQTIGYLSTATERDVHTLSTSFALLLTAAIEDDARILVDECMKAAHLCVPSDALVELLLTALHRLYSNLGVVSKSRICADDVESYLQAERTRKSSLAAMKRHKKSRDTMAELEREAEIDRIYLLRIAFLIHCWLSEQTRKDVAIPGLFLQLLKICRCSCISEDVNAQAVRATALLCMLNRDTATTTIPVIQSMLNASKEDSVLRDACYQALLDNMCEFGYGIFLPPVANSIRPNEQAVTQAGESEQRDDTAAARAQYDSLCDHILTVCAAKRLTTLTMGVCKLLATGAIRAEDSESAVRVLLVELFHLQVQENAMSTYDSPMNCARFQTSNVKPLSSIISYIDSFLAHFAHSHPRRMYAVAKASIAACQEILTLEISAKVPKRAKLSARSQSFSQGDFRRIWRRILYFTDAWYLQCVRELDPSSVNAQNDDVPSDMSDTEIFDYRSNTSASTDDGRTKSIHHAIYGKSVARELSRCSCHEFIALGVIVELLCLPSDIAARVIPELTRIRLYKKDDKVLLRQLVSATQRCKAAFSGSRDSATLEKSLQRILQTLRHSTGGEFFDAQLSYSQMRSTQNPSNAELTGELPTSKSPAEHLDDSSAQATHRQSRGPQNTPAIDVEGAHFETTSETTLFRSIQEIEQSLDSMVQIRKSDLRNTRSLQAEKKIASEAPVTAETTEPSRKYSLRKR